MPRGKAPSSCKNLAGEITARLCIFFLLFFWSVFIGGISAPILNIDETGAVSESKAKRHKRPEQACGSHAGAAAEPQNEELRCCTFLASRRERARYVTCRWWQLAQQRGSLSFDIFVIAAAAVTVLKIPRGGKKWLLSKEGGAGYSHTGSLDLGVCVRVRACNTMCVFVCLCKCLLACAFASAQCR